jgi:hypothetical protein
MSILTLRAPIGTVGGLSRNANIGCIWIIFRCNSTGMILEPGAAHAEVSAVYW